MTEIKFYTCDYDYQKELKCLLYFTNFNRNDCHDLICIIHKCRGDYTINKDKILVEHIYQNINNLYDFCINNHLNVTIKHNLDYLFSTINNQTYPIHVDYTCEIKLSRESNKND